jgi:hypothetical protein
MWESEATAAELAVKGVTWIGSRTALIGRLLGGLTDYKSEYGRGLQRKAVRSVSKAW